MHPISLKPCKNAMSGQEDSCNLWWLEIFGVNYPQHPNFGDVCVCVCAGGGLIRTLLLRMAMHVPMTCQNLFWEFWLRHPHTCTRIHTKSKFSAIAVFAIFFDGEHCLRSNFGFLRNKYEVEFESDIGLVGSGHGDELRRTTRILFVDHHPRLTYTRFRPS